MKNKNALSTAKLLIILISILFLVTTANSQIIVNSKVEDIDSKTKSEVIESISKILNDNYVFPSKAKEMEEFIKTKLNSGDYDKINDPRELGEQLTKDLQSISKDKHLRLRFSPEEVNKIKNQAVGNKDEELDAGRIEMMKYENFGFKKVERLNGNIGYVDFRYFAPAKYSKETIASVMSFLSNCDAIIIDLRQNGGGEPSGVQQICSYFFDSNPVHLNDLYFRPENKTEEFWTLKDIQGKRMPNIDLYVLTSNYTFSGAEEFAYNLKNLKRATLVGEITGGGAHPGDIMPVNGLYVMFVPNGRAINPITKTNWEGVGVIPDVEVASDKALETAQLMALEKLAQKTTNKELKNKLEWEAEFMKAIINPISIDESTLKSLSGNYGEREVTFENGELYYQRKGRPKLKMIPMTEDQFMFKEVDYFRAKFVKDSNGNVIELLGIYDNGQTDISKRTN